MRKPNTVATVKQGPRVETRGRKPDGKKIVQAVESQWARIDRQIKARLAKDLPLRVSDAKRHVLRIAAETIMLSTGKGNRK